MVLPALRAAAAIASLDIPVSSSAISSISYDVTTLTLTITFRDSGKSYDYEVNPLIYAGLMAASSKGAYFNEYIKGS
jgi:hypothetical protein